MARTRKKASPEAEAPAPTPAATPITPAPPPREEAPAGGKRSSRNSRKSSASTTATRKPAGKGQAGVQDAAPAPTPDAGLREAVEQLGRELADARGQVKGLVRDVRAEVKGLREELARAQESLVAHQSALRSLQETVGQLSRELADAQALLEGAEVSAREGEAPAEPRRTGSPGGSPSPQGSGAPREGEAPAREGEAPADPAPAAEGRDRLGVTVAPGVVVAEVTPYSQAAEAGLLPGDVIHSVDGTTVRTGPELRDLVQGKAAGQEVSFRVARGGEMLVLSSRLAPPPEGEEQADGGSRLGLTVAPGVVVAAVLPDSPAAHGLQPGDVITHVNGAEVLNGPELRSAIQPLEERAQVRLRITRAGQQFEVKARLDEPLPPEVAPPPLPVS